MKAFCQGRERKVKKVSSDRGRRPPCSSREACFVTVKKRSSPPPSSGVQSVWKSIADHRRRLRIKKSFGEAPTEFVALSRQQREKILVGPAKIEGGLRSRWSSPQRQLWIAQKKNTLSENAMSTFRKGLSRRFDGAEDQKREIFRFCSFLKVCCKHIHSNFKATFPLYVLQPSNNCCGDRTPFSSLP